MTPHSGWAALFWEVFARSANAMLLLDYERLIIEANGAFVALVGHRRTALMGRPVVDLLAGGPPPGAIKPSARRTESPGMSDTGRG